MKPVVCFLHARRCLNPIDISLNRGARFLPSTILVNDGALSGWLATGTC